MRERSMSAINIPDIAAFVRATCHAPSLSYFWLPDLARILL
jgi:hypothetical protein